MAQTPPMTLDRDRFMRRLIRELAGTLEDIVGYEETAGYISLVGQRMGDWLDGEYRRMLDREALDRDGVASTLVDLKRRIGGDFSVLEVSPERIVLGSQACPFQDQVIGRPSMCMMTSNVFGCITANNLGYAKVVLEETIAGGNDHCRVVIHLQHGQASQSAQGREYYGRP